MAIAYIGLGSNLKNPHQQLEKALIEISQIPNTELSKSSQFYQTKPVGYLDQPDFINAVVKISTTLTADELLKHLLSIESQHGRVRGAEKFGPRELDCDILLYDNYTIYDEALTIPHPRMKERAFVLIPLAEVAPDLIFPDGEKLADLIAMMKLS